MKSRITYLFIIILGGMMLFSCSTSPEKKIAGTWKVEDVQFNTDSTVDQAALDASEKSQKAVSYELMKDHSAKIHVGSSVLEGNWIYKNAGSEVYMVFTGAFDTILLGRYEDGKLINKKDKPDISITTIFTKEKE